MVLTVMPVAYLCGRWFGDDKTLPQGADPGLGTLAGGVPLQDAARQMAAAYRHFLAPPDRISWEYAVARQSAVCGEV